MAEDDLRANPANRPRAVSALIDTEIARLDVDDLLAEQLERVTELLHADTAAVLLLDEGSGRLRTRAARGVEEAVREGVSVPVGIGFAGRIAAERRPVTLDRVDATTVVNPILWEKGIRSMLGVPLQSGRRLLGVLHVGRLSGHRFDEDDAKLLERVGERVGAAVERRELEAERAAIQQSLLPAAAPSCEGLELATRYVTAEPGGVGGDWYDAFVLEDGALWIVVGDVAGHGLRASTDMGRLRSTLRSYALERCEPAEVLQWADRKLQRFVPDAVATVLCGVSFAPYARLRLASAGHLPPALATKGQPPSLVDVPVGPALGVVPRASRASVEIALPTGAVLLAYTDGLVERRGEVLDVGLQRLLGAVRAAPPTTVCDEVMAALLAGRTPSDDIALLALRRLARGGGRRDGPAGRRAARRADPLPSRAARGAPRDAATRSSPRRVPLLSRVVSCRPHRAAVLGLALTVGLLAPAAVAAGASSSHGRAAGRLPEVSGSYGKKPQLTFPKGAAPTRLVVKVLHKGHGPVVRKGDLAVVNYYGQIWRGKVFDTSWGRGLFATPIGVGQVIPGWDKGIVGERVGSRLLLSIPPADGYGKKGDPQGGITGTDTLEFVVDVVGAYDSHAHGDPRATLLHHEIRGVKVGGRLGGKPTIQVTKGAPKPSTVTVTMIARGHGPKIRPGLLIDQYVVGTWSGGSQASTWSSIPDHETLGNAQTPSVLDKTIGMPLGSRVLVELPKTSSGGPYALVVDLVAEPKD